MKINLHHPSHGRKRPCYFQTKPAKADSLARFTGLGWGSKAIYRLASIGLVLALSATTGWATVETPRRGVSTDTLPTLARLSFWVPPQRVVEFESAYEAKVVPILKAHGLTESSERGRATPDSIFSRLFEVKTPLEMEEKQKALQGDSAWTAVLRVLGTTFGTSQPDSLIQNSLMLYSAPAGPGKVVKAGPGKIVPAGQGTGHWRTYDVADGFIGANVRSILQDRDGYLWFGTLSGGVSRFDGQKFIAFTTKDGLVDNKVSSIIQDRDGYLWFGTWNNGVSRYDGKTFTTFTTKNGLADNTVSSIIQDREGHLWFGTYGGGVSRYDGKTFTTFTTKDGLANNQVRSILQDREGHLWFGTGGGCVSRYDPSTGSGGAGKPFTTFTTKDGLAKNNDVRLANDVGSIFQDRDGYLWFGTDSGGVSRFDGQKFITFTAKDGLAANGVGSIFQDREGHLWFGTHGGGVSRYDGKAFTNFTTQDGLVNNWVWSIFQDREGHLWFGTTGGVSRYDGQFTTFTTKDGLTRNNVGPIFQDRGGNLWFGTGGGVSRYDLSAGAQAGGKTFTIFTTKDGLAANGIYSIFQDREGNLWFGSWNNGVSRYDGKTFINFTTEDGLPDNMASADFQDREGNLWFGTAGGVSRYDGKTFINFTTEDGLANNVVWSIFQDQEGHLWFGTYGGGVSRYDPSTPGSALRSGQAPSASSGRGGKTFTTFTTRDGLASNDVSSILQDREGHLWFGTYGGVSRYDDKTFINFTTEDGLADNSVTKILQNREGVLWFGTWGGGVSRYDGRVFQTLTRQDGLSSNNLVNAIFQDREGYLWFSIQDGGVTRYRPPVPSPPPAFVDAVVADRRYEKVSELAIPSSVKLTAFEFHGMSFKTRPEAMVYRYRLNGYDKDWKNTHARRVEYHDLPRGTYTFEVVAVDRDLVYSKTPATVMLRVHLPYMLIGLWSALSIAVALVAWQTARVIRRDRRLAAANQALSAANEGLFQVNRELEEANAQIQQATQRKSAFLASMSHELRTPMNAIKGFTSLVLRREPSLTERGKQNLEKVGQASDHLLAMINDLLDLSKIEAGRMDVNPERFDVRALVASCCDTVSPLFLTKGGVELRQEVAPEVDQAHTDQARLRQMLVNLLSNAIKFTDAGSVTVRASQRDGHLVLAVSDTGKGIPSEHLPTIFDEYRQVKGQSESAVQRGTGLGLSITKRFAELLGGTIGVESEVGKGSVFTVRVPVVYQGS